MDDESEVIKQLQKDMANMIVANPIHTGGGYSINPNDTLTADMFDNLIEGRNMSDRKSDLKKFYKFLNSDLDMRTKMIFSDPKSCELYIEQMSDLTEVERNEYANIVKESFEFKSL
ncbi:MAG: hypothetical protein KAS32_20560 [Candidatus Peribacteraceae bacterium]|nr:hypothetical protein [Candidatus Peribacteraceae bacterium]